LKIPRKIFLKIMTSILMANYNFLKIISMLTVNNIKSLKFE